MAGATNSTPFPPSWGPPKLLPWSLLYLWQKSSYLKELLAEVGCSRLTQSKWGKSLVRAKLLNRVARQCCCTRSNISVKMQNIMATPFPRGLGWRGTGEGWGEGGRQPAWKYSSVPWETFHQSGGRGGHSSQALRRFLVF